MSFILAISIAGAVLNLTGAIILSYSFGKYFNAVDNSFSAMEKSIKGIAETLNNPNKSGLVFLGMEMHRDKGAKKTKQITQFGIFLLILGFLFQVIVIIN